MKSRKMFSLALALIVAFSLIPTQRALAADSLKIISLPSLDYSTTLEYTLSNATSGTVEYTYNTYENYRLVGESEEFDTVPHTVTVYQVPINTIITAKGAGNIRPTCIYVGQNEPDNSITNLSYNETYGDFRPQYDVIFIVPDTENYYYIGACSEVGRRYDNGLWIKGVDSTTQPETVYGPGIKTATPSPCVVYVNFNPVNFDAYVIDGNNYMKLRDVAYALRDTNKKFNVDWDGTQNAINMISNTDYVAVGNEMSAGDGQAKGATPCTATILLDGTPVELVGYTIGQNNYFKLRSICEEFNIYVEWVPSDGSVLVDTHINELMEMN